MCLVLCIPLEKSSYPIGPHVKHKPEVLISQTNSSTPNEPRQNVNYLLLLTTKYVYLIRH